MSGSAGPFWRSRADFDVCPWTRYTGPGDSYKEGRGCATRLDPDTTSNIAQVAPNSGICFYDDRAYDFLGESNRVAADLGLGVPPEEETVPAAAKPADTLDE